MAISKPFYIKTRDCPQKASTSKICKACEKISGTKSMKAAMWNKNVWILNASSEEARVFLLGAGSINIDGSMVRLYGDHPFISLDKDGNKIPSTKLVIDGIPIEIEGDVITRYLASIGISTRSKLNFENAWDPEKKSLTEWLTGKRFIYIDLPQKELKKIYKMGEYDMKLYYKEMEKETPRCKRCFGPHWTNTCQEEERCLSCKLPGHRRGDPTCPKVIEDFEQSENDDMGEGMSVGNSDERDSDYDISADEAEVEAKEDMNEEQTNDEEKLKDGEGLGEQIGESGEAADAEKNAVSEGGQESINNSSASPVNDDKHEDTPKPTAEIQKSDNKKEKIPDKDKSEKRKTGKEVKKHTKNDKLPLNRLNGQKQAPPRQDRGRSQERLDKYVQRNDRSVSKRRASKSPNSANLESKYRRSSMATGRGNAQNYK